MESILKFKGFNIIDVNYSITGVAIFEGNEDSDKFVERLKNGNVDLDIKIGHPDEMQTTDGEIRNLLTVRTHDYINNDSIRRISLSIEGLFEVNQEPDKDELNQVLLPNMVAILMPYARTYLSNLTGFDTSRTHLLMPPVNVYALFENQDKNNTFE